MGSSKLAGATGSRKLTLVIVTGSIKDSSCSIERKEKPG